ncbi:MAG: T9SS type A sorting domain-containing protein, partial [Candidatus Latescibacteria bacterium]|nr:T9SS type A sorting domain-containing protein [Candidatus Latescibacterota bacterium]
TVTPELGKTVRVNGVTGVVESTTDTPGQTRIWVVFTVVNLVIEAVDQNGTALSTANGFSTNGHVELSASQFGEPTLPIPGFPIGAPLSVKGSYTGQGAADYTPVTVQENMTVRVNGITGAALPAVASAGQTRVQIVFASILVTIKTVDQNGANLNGDIDVPGDPAGPSPFLLSVVVGQALGVNGTYQGLGLPTATFTDVTSQVGIDKTVKIDGAMGAIISVTSTPGQTQVLVVFSTGTLIVSAVNQAGVPLGMANGFAMDGQVTFAGGTTTTGTPSLTINQFPIDGSFGVSGSFNGAGFAGLKTVTPQLGKTVRVDGATGTITGTVPSENAGHLAGETRADVVFTVADFTIKTVDQNDNLLPGSIDILSTSAVGSKTISSYVLGKKNGGDPISLIAQMQGNGAGSGFSGVAFQTGQVDTLFKPGHTLRVNALTGQILNDAANLSGNQVALYLVYEVIPITLRTTRLNGDHVPGRIDVPGPPLEPSPFVTSAIVGSTIGVRGEYLGGSSGAFVNVLVVKGRRTHLIVNRPEPGFFESSSGLPADVETFINDDEGVNEIWVQFETVDVIVQALNKAASPLAPMPNSEVNVQETQIGYLPSPHTYNALVEGRFKVVGRSTDSKGTAFGQFTTITVKKDAVSTVDETVDPATVSSPVPTEDGTTRIDILLQTNQKPAFNPTGPQAVDEGQLLTFTVSATDPDAGDVLTYTATGLPSGATFDALTRTLSWTPDFTQAGPYTVTFTATDNGNPILSVSQTVSITVNDVNRAPALAIDPNGNAADGSFTVNEGVALNFSVNATDLDVGDGLTITATGVPTGATFSGGTFTWTPDFTQAGTYPVTFKVEDNGSPKLSSTKLVTITVNNVNRAPILTVPASVPANEGVALSFHVSAADSDIGDVVTFTATDLPSGATFSDSTLTWTPTFTQSGSYTVKFTVTDNGNPNLGDGPKSVTITVNNMNRAPILTVPASVPAVNEGVALTFGVTATDPDIGDVVTFTATDLPSGATFNGTLFSWTPGFAQAGMYAVKFTATDNGNPILSDGPKSVTITVNNVNRPPTANAGPDQTVNEGVAVTLSGSGTDPDAGDVLAFQWTQVSGSSATLTGANTATPTFTAPQVTADETLRFKLVATDNGSPALSSTPETVSITVRNVGPPPNWMYVGVHSGAPDIQKGLRNEDIVKFSRDLQGDVIASTLERWFDGSLFFKGDEQLDAAAVIDLDGDGNLDMVFSVRSKANLKMGGLEMLPADLVAYYPARTANKFEKFLEGSRILKSYHGNREKADKDRRDDEYKECRESRENIDGVAVRKVGSAWKVFLTTTKDAKFEAFKFDQNDVVQFDYNATTKKISNPVKVLDTNSLFKGKESNIDALDVLDDNGNGTLGSIVFSTSTKEKLNDGREIRASVVYAYNREANTTEEIFDPKEDGLSKTQVNIGNVSFIGPLKTWGTGPKPEPAPKAKKGQALLAKVGEETGTPEIVPEAFGMDQNYPNPFNPSTTIRYALPKAANVTLVIYNILGQQIRTLLNGAQAAGYHTVVWDGRDEVGRTTATGMYIYRFQAGVFVQTRKMLFAK